MHQTPGPKLSPDPYCRAGRVPGAQVPGAPCKPPLLLGSQVRLRPGDGCTAPGHRASTPETWGQDQGSSISTKQAFIFSQFLTELATKWKQKEKRTGSPQGSSEAESQRTGTREPTVQVQGGFSARTEGHYLVSSSLH